MKSIRYAFLTCLAIIGATAPAHAAFQLLYVVIGVFDNGGLADNGVATSIHCANVSTTTSGNARVHVRRKDGTVAGSVLTQTIPPQGTVTFSTHPTLLFVDAGLNESLGTGVVAQGSARISSETPTLVVCSAELIDASSTVPTGASRRMIKFPRSTSGGED